MPTPVPCALAAEAAELLDQADALLVAAGAGMGVDSGLPDFRGNAGFWNAYPALGRARLGFTQVACPQTFRDDPRRAWGFYGHRLRLYRDTTPHAGFDILRRWASRMPNGAFVFTSNVDGQFQRAGFDEAGVHECHGSLMHLQCLVPCSADSWSAAALQPDVDAETVTWRGPLPTCPRCGALARPNVLMFGDDGWVPRRAQQQQARLDDWLKRVRRPLVVELGAGEHVPSVRHFSHFVTQAHGGWLVRINPRDTCVPERRALAIAAGALPALEAIDRALADGAARAD